MNFIGKTSGDDSGSSTGSRRQQQEEEDEEERRNTTTGGPTGQSLFPNSSSSSSPSSHQHHQPPSFHQPPNYHHQNPRGGWMFDGHGGEPSTRIISSHDPMMLDNYSQSSVPSVTPASADTNNNNDDDNQQGGGERGMMMVVEREHMFDKVVTPSDVGKLNRLVIPKQHAERYFPLDSSTNDKGLLLNFEDRNGKPWRFRYSYWNSSQSYVMTKGWSRFVKDKKLDAGDIVSFQRGVGGSAKDRLFIDWRHRPDAPAPPYQLSSFPLPHHHQYSFQNRNIHPWNPLFLQSQPVPSRSHSNLMLQPPNYRYGLSNTTGPYHNIGTGSVVNVNNNQGGGGGSSSSSSVIYFRSAAGGGGIPQHQMDMMQMHHQRSGVGIGSMDPPVAALLPPPPTPQSHHPPSLVFESVPVVHGKAAAKRLRLFGVNMDCPISDEDDQADYDGPSSSELMSPTMASAATTSMGIYHHDQNPLYHYPPTPSSSSSTIPYLQLRPNYGGGSEISQHHESPMASSPSTDIAFNKANKSSSSSHMSLDLDI